MTRSSLFTKGFVMWPYHLDLLATPLPRYTGFPTAAPLDPYRAKSPRRFSSAV